MSLAVLFHSCEGKTLQDRFSSKKGVCWAAQRPCLRQAVITVKADRWLSIFASDPLPPCYVLNSWSDSQVPWLALAMLRKGHILSVLNSHFSAAALSCSL